MSATNRGTTRNPHDFYATPHPSVAAMIGFLPKPWMCSPIWEPCCGDGRIVAALRAKGYKADGADLYDHPAMRPLCLEADVNYLKDETLRDFVITNPPFSIAFEMCQHALAHSREFMFLLRLSFLESETRADWLSANEPGALFVLKKRPSFVMSVTCKSGGFDPHGAPCKHNWLLPIESERPKICPVCNGDRLAISTSDNCGYAWFYWGDRFKGIHHI